MLEHLQSIMQQKGCGIIGDTAKRLHMSISGMSHIIRGDRRMTVQTFAKLCRALELDRATILELLREAADE